jgi:hypothetical protein
MTEPAPIGAITAAARRRCPMHYWEAGAAKTACGLSNCRMGTTANVLRVTCKQCLRARVDPACADLNYSARR